MRVAGVVAVWALAHCAGCRGEPDPGAVHDGWSGTPPAEPAAVEEPCDEEWVECVEGAFCDRGGDGWPGCDDIGACVAAPKACEPDDRPVCGCDGQLYANACAAAMAGIGSAGAVGCDPPVGKFSCGLQFCELQTDYCKHTIGHGEPESWLCVALDCPADAAGCACVPDPWPCGDPEYYPGQWCNDLPGGGTEVTCLPA